MSEKKFDNQYVRQYYDTYLGTIGEYEAHRWHATPHKRFEYRQMARSIKRGLGSGHYVNALEVGPGDAVWTPLFRSCAQSVHLIEQSGEMLKRAQQKLSSVSAVTFEHADLTQASEGEQYELVAAIRCFEYFEDKEAALAKLFRFTAPGGRLLLITKNIRLLHSEGIRQKPIHTGQLNRTDLVRMLERVGFEVERVYPAVFRLKAGYLLARIFFDLLHRAMVAVGSYKIVPFATYATESYTYVARRV